MSNEAEWFAPHDATVCFTIKLASLPMSNLITFVCHWVSW